MAEVRYCAFCDQQVEEAPQPKEKAVTVQEGNVFPYRHKPNPIPNCGRRGLTEDQTYTES